MLYAGAAKITVTPKARDLDKTMVPLLARGMGERVAKTTRRLPTEGNLDLREYRDGDDVRRIHWIRSLAANQLIVRLPDEIPPDRPNVRIILDTFFPEAFVFQTDTPAEVLDAMVGGVWLAVGRAFAERGTRVRLVVAGTQNGTMVPRTLDLSPRTPSAALALGASVAWQSQLQVSDLWTDEATFVVSHGVHAATPEDGAPIRWIIVVPAELSGPTSSHRIGRADALPARPSRKPPLASEPPRPRAGQCSLRPREGVASDDAHQRCATSARKLRRCRARKRDPAWRP